MGGHTASTRSRRVGRRALKGERRVCELMVLLLQTRSLERRLDLGRMRDAVGGSVPGLADGVDGGHLPVRDG